MFNATNGTVTLDLDQRINSVDTKDICILNSAGDRVVNPNPVSADIPSQAAGPEAVVLHFVAGASGPVAPGTQLAFGTACGGDAGALGSDALVAQINNNGQNNTGDTGSLTIQDGLTADQIVAPVGSGASLHAYHRPARKHSGTRKRHSTEKHKRS